jgi:hypothetical protein
LEFEKNLHEKEVKDQQEAQLKKLQSLIKTTISKEFKPIQKCIEDTSASTTNSFTTTNTDVKLVKKSVMDLSKTSMKISKDSSELVDLTKQTIKGRLPTSCRYGQIGKGDKGGDP